MNPHTNATSATTVIVEPCRFLTLPGELRNEIYEFVFADLRTSTTNENIGFMEAESNLPKAYITQTCHQLRSETIVYYREVLAEYWTMKVFWSFPAKDGWPTAFLGEFRDVSLARRRMVMVRRLEQMRKIVIRRQDRDDRPGFISLRRSSTGDRIQARVTHGKPWTLPTRTMLGSLEYIWES